MPTVRLYMLTGIQRTFDKPRNGVICGMDFTAVDDGNIVWRWKESLTSTSPVQSEPTPAVLIECKRKVKTDIRSNQNLIYQTVAEMLGTLFQKEREGLLNYEIANRYTVSPAAHSPKI